MDGPLAAEISRLRAMAEKAGLDPGPVSFEIARPDMINQIAAYVARGSERNPGLR